MGYLNRLIDAKNTREGRVLSAFVAFILAFSIAGMPLFGETALAAQDDGNDSTATAVSSDTAATAEQPASVQQSQATLAPAGDATVDALSVAASAGECAHGEWAVSDTRWISEDAVHPTCTQPGVCTKTCPLCGEVAFQVETAALGHNFESLMCVDDTEHGFCEDGCITHRHRMICESCDGEEAGGVLYEEHAYGGWEVVREATADNPGEQQRICLGCCHMQTAPVPADSVTAPGLADPESPAAIPADPAGPANAPAAAEPTDTSEPEGAGEPDAPSIPATPGEPGGPMTPADESGAGPAAGPAGSAEPDADATEVIEDDANPLSAPPEQETDDSGDSDTILSELIDEVQCLFQWLVAPEGSIASHSSGEAGSLHANALSPTLESPFHHTLISLEHRP